MKSTNARPFKPGVALAYAALSALQAHPDAARLIREAAASYLTER